MRSRFAVEEELCIGCGLCHERAPDNVEIDEVERHARVTKQPNGDAEEEACVEAAEYCPTGGLRKIPAGDEGA